MHLHAPLLFEQLLAGILTRLGDQQQAGKHFVNCTTAAPKPMPARRASPATLLSARAASASEPVSGLGNEAKLLSAQLGTDQSGRSRAAHPGWGRLVLPPSPVNSTSSAAILDPLPAPLDRPAREIAFAQLQSRMLACGKCPHLVSSRRTVVVGVGDIQARLMFVGEAPGADEDAQGEPFVGKAGELLTKIITAMGLSRSQVFIANILKCRPDTPGQSAGNRKPTPAEMATCSPWLHEQIDLIQPEVMVALGATAVEGLLGKTEGITRLRGHWQSYRGIPLMPTFHPAYLLRNQAPAEKRKVWEDMLAVLEHLRLPISPKQRNFFLPQQPNTH
jgi:DNA polymerase